MTIGQRIAQKRKELGLSQEALGDKLGVSRQSIYKWESDSALPEIDKLIALSRLFGVSVGWVLEVEDPPPETAEVPPEAELTEQQLKMVEEIVERYTAALPKLKKSPWDKWSVRILFAICGLMVGCLMGISHDVKEFGGQYGQLQSEITRVESSVNSQIGSIEGRVEELLEAQNSLLADSGAEIAHTSLEAREENPRGVVVFSAYAVPKTYAEGMTAEFTLDNGAGGVTTVPGSFRPSTQTFYTDSIACALTDDISLAVAFLFPDGTRQTQLLAHYDSLFTASLPVLHLNSFAENLQISEDSFIPQTFYLSLKEESGAYWGSYGESFPAASVQEV